MRTLAILIAFSLAAFGQRHKAPEEVDAEKPDGKLMQQIMQESDPGKVEHLYLTFWLRGFLILWLWFIEHQNAGKDFCLWEDRRVTKVYNAL